MALPLKKVQALLQTGAVRAMLADHNLKTLDTDGEVDIWDVSTLTYINICKNKLEVIPPQLALLDKLEELHVAGNRLKTISKLSDLSKLAVFNANQNLLEEFPRGIGGCPNLQLLDLSMNLITKIPTNIRFCITLRALWVTDNRIKELPDCITELENLQILGLRNNRIELLPDQIGTMPKLRELYVDDNCLRVLPVSLKHSPALKHQGQFSVLNNFFCTQVEESLNQCNTSNTFNPLIRMLDTPSYQSFYEEFHKNPSPLDESMVKALKRRDAAGGVAKTAK